MNKQEAMVILSNQEEWRDIVDYEGFYQISNLGNIKSLDRVVNIKNKKGYLKTGKSIIPTKNSRGYLTFSLTIDGKTITYNVMQLTEVGDYEAQNFKLKQMYNRSRNVHITTTPPILVRCCYVPFFFINLN